MENYRPHRSTLLTFWGLCPGIFGACAPVFFGAYAPVFLGFTPWYFRGSYPGFLGQNTRKLSKIFLEFMPGNILELYALDIEAIASKKRLLLSVGCMIDYSILFFCPQENKLEAPKEGGFFDAKM